MELKFIDHNAAKDGRSRKAIRSHVMKGKNAGKKLQRGRKHAPDKGFFHDAAKVPEKDPGTEESSEDSQLIFPEIAEMDKAVVPLNHFSGTEFAYFAFPIQFTSSMRYMVHQFHQTICDVLYPITFCRPYTEGKQPWFRFMVSDQAFLHCLLAMTATFLSLFKKPETEPLEATRHFSQTLRLVNRELSTNTLPRESTFAVVTSLSIHCNLIGDVKNSEIHLRGLQRMLDLRPGGLLEMREYNLALMHKICRTDIDVAMLQGTATCFGFQVAAVQHALVAASLGGGSARKLPPSLDELCAPLKYITRDVLALCRRPGRAKMDAFQFQDVMISICYRLLDLAPLQGPRLANTLDNAWHLGLLGFMTTIIYASECLRTIYCKRIRTLFMARVDNSLENRPLQLWLLFVCGLSAVTEEQQPIAKIKALVDELTLKTWEDVRACLKPFPWIGIVHDGPGKEIWEQCQRA